MNGKKIGAGYARGGGTWRASGGVEQGQNATGVVDGMGQHRVGRLGQNAGTHEVDGFGRHVGVLNSGARCCIIFRHYVQVVNRVFEAGLDGTEFAAGAGYGRNLGVNVSDGLAEGLVIGVLGDVAELRAGDVNHVNEGDGDGVHVGGVRADLEAQSVGRFGVAPAQRCAPRGAPPAPRGPGAPGRSPAVMSGSVCWPRSTYQQATTASSTFQTRQPTIHPLVSAVDVPVVKDDVHVAGVTKRSIL